MEEKNINAQNESVETEQKVNEKIDVDKLSEKDRKKLLKSLIKENEELIQKNTALESESKSYKDSWIRISADFENYKKRNQEARSIAYKDGKIDVLTKILDVGDNLDRALLLNLDEKTKEGIEMTARRYYETLQSIDVSVINPVGEDFDPNTQEAIMKVPAGEGEKEGTVKQVYLKGYKLGDKIIRYAQVVVIG